MTSVKQSAGAIRAICGTSTSTINVRYYMWYEGRSCGEPMQVADRRPGGRGLGGKSQVGLATLRSETFFFTL